MTPTEVKDDDKVEQKQKQTETLVEVKDVEKVEQEQKNYTANEKEDKVEEQSTGKEKGSSTKALSFPAPTSTSSAPTPSPATSANITTTTLLPPPLYPFPQVTLYPFHYSPLYFLRF
uniref:Uncharacterized protein n=1 Tax=Proboscia inermis TaxID=420281 RepID=A0A7S0C176_9STRA|mmetsp:Transcript_21198/g.21510  ORF Transcript_21198/g.21510 Transcript_21198/m.21510 type:complete len:117 (+) Transcript_21198:289-639(+)